MTSWSHPRDSQVTGSVQNPLEPQAGSARYLVEGPWAAPFVDIVAGGVSVWVMQCRGRLPKNLTNPEVGWATIRW